jgi:cysteine desulfurase/selenocysteine lyase
MSTVAAHAASLTARAMDGLSAIGGLRIYGVPRGTERTPLVAFNVAGSSPFDIARSLNAQGVESRAGCHCATLAHHDLGIDPPASCRVSFTLYNTPEEVDRVVEAVRRAVEEPRGSESGSARSRRSVAVSGDTEHG